MLMMAKRINFKQVGGIMSIGGQCKVEKRLDLKLQDLGDLQQLIAEHNSNNVNYFFYITSLGEKLKFVRLSKGLWINEDYNITIRAPV